MTGVPPGRTWAVASAGFPASWSELNLSAINDDVPDLGPDFNIDLLGIKSFQIDPEQKIEELEKEILFEFKIEVSCFNEENQKELSEELEKRGFKVRILI